MGPALGLIPEILPGCIVTGQLASSLLELFPKSLVLLLLWTLDVFTSTDYAFNI